MTCIFHDPSGSQTTVQALIIKDGEYGKAVCRAPYFKRTGLTRIQLQINETYTLRNTTFSGPFTISNEEPTLKVEFKTFSNSPLISLAFSWSTALFLSINEITATARVVGIRMIAFDSANANWVNVLNLDLGHKNVTTEMGSANTTLVYGNISWLVSADKISNSFIAFRIDVVGENLNQNHYYLKTGML